MNNEDLIKKLKKSGLTEAPVKAEKARAKAALMKAHGEKFGREKRAQPVFYRYITAVAAVFAFSLLTFFVVDNMDDGDKFNRRGGIWSTYSDRLEGGDSVVWPPEHRESSDGFIMSSPGYGGAGYAVRVTGRTGSRFGLNYNYLGVVLRFDSDSYCPKCEGSDISKYSGIRFKIKGDLSNGELSFVLPHESDECIAERMTCGSLTNYADYFADISGRVGASWKTVTIDFRNDLKQPFWTKEENKTDIEEVLKTVHLFKWQYRNGDGGKMDIWIDNVELY